MANDSIPSPQGHVVLFTIDAWGHVRPLCVMAAKFVKSQRMHITLFSSPVFSDRVEAELARSFSEDEKELRELIRVVALQASEPYNPLDTAAIFASFVDAYQKLIDQAPLTCIRTGITYPAVPPPTAVIIDFFCHEPIKAIRAKSTKPVKIYAWFSGAASLLIPLFGPVHRGGRGDLTDEVHAEALKSGRDVRDVAQEILLGVNGRILRPAGLPAVYDYELHPQELIIKDPIIGIMWLKIYSTLELCDGIIFNTPSVLEPAALAEIRDWYAETERKVFVIGTLLPEHRDEFKVESRLTTNAGEIERFMQTILEEKGERSMLYISFGSVFWTTKPEQVWAFLDVVIKKNIPFIMSHASPFCQVPEEVQEKVKNFKYGMLSPWSPQQAILAHPVTGWFLTHGGHNSLMESVTAGVPMICWPFHADQPFNSIHLSENLDVAYELIEVRTGHGLHPRLRTGKAPVATLESIKDEAEKVLEDAFEGEGGKRKRENMRKLKEDVLNGWKEGGAAKAEFAKLTAEVVV